MLSLVFYERSPFDSYNVVLSNLSKSLPLFNKILFHIPLKAKP